MYGVRLDRTLNKIYITSVLVVEGSNKEELIANLIFGKGSS